MHSNLTLIGDGIENPWNARTMIDAARMYGAQCAFRDRKDLAATFRSVTGSDVELNVLSLEEILQTYSPIIALENQEGAEDIGQFKLPPGANPALIAGNEKFGIAQDLLRRAGRVVQIPLPPGTLNTLNVAAACGVALHYLSSGGRSKFLTRNNPQKHRPEILLVGGSDQFELGSSIRSAAAFGWNRMLLDDRGGVWFEADRGTRSQGRAAARRGRNSIRIARVGADDRFAFRQVTVVSAHYGEAVGKVRLAEGGKQLIVVPDESLVNVRNEDWSRFGVSVQFAQVAAPVDHFAYHYRLFASIALAECARQVGMPLGTRKEGRGRKGHMYESALDVLVGGADVEVSLDDLRAYG